MRRIIASIALGAALALAPVAALAQAGHVVVLWQRRGGAPYPHPGTDALRPRVESR